jgi:hypothetical protein
LTRVKFHAHRRDVWMGAAIIHFNHGPGPGAQVEWRGEAPVDGGCVRYAIIRDATRNRARRVTSSLHSRYDRRPADLAPLRGREASIAELQRRHDRVQRNRVGVWCSPHRRRRLGMARGSRLPCGSD